MNRISNQNSFFFLLIDRRNKIKNLKPIKWLDICDNMVNYVICVNIVRN